ncbi:hypothetical protein E3U43_017978, partial [Larimichthys crocea]
DAHPWLCARCQETLREPQTFLRTQREYPEPQLKPVAVVEAENEALMECTLEWRGQHAAWGSQLGQRPTSVTHCQDTTEDTRRRVRQPLLGGMPCGLTYIETQSQTEENVLPLHAELSNRATSFSRIKTEKGGGEGHRHSDERMCGESGVWRENERFASPVWQSRSGSVPVWALCPRGGSVWLALTVAQRGMHRDARERLGECVCGGCLRLTGRRGLVCICM